MPDFSPYTPLSTHKYRSLVSAAGMPLLWNGQEQPALEIGEYVSDWIPVNFETIASLALELIWNGDIEAAATLQGIINQIPFDLPIDLSSIEPDGTTYAGDLDAEDLSGEDLGHMPVDVYGSPPFTKIRLKLNVTSGSGACVANMSASLVGGNR